MYKLAKLIENTIFHQKKVIDTVEDQLPSTDIVYLIKQELITHH